MFSPVEHRLFLWKDNINIKVHDVPWRSEQVVVAHIQLLVIVVLISIVIGISVFQEMFDWFITYLGCISANQPNE